MCMVSFCFADKMRIIWIVISLAPMVVASMTRREAHGDGDDIIGERGELSSRMTEEDRHRLQNQLREELRAILLRAEWENAKRTMRRASVVLFLCLVAVMSYFMWRWRKESRRGRSRGDAEEALRQHYEAPAAAAAVRAEGQSRASRARPLLNPTNAGNENRSSPPPPRSPPAEIDPTHLNVLKNKSPPPTYEEAILSK